LINRTVVYTGPTLGCERAEKVLNATYLPPVQQGDVVRVMNTLQPSTIVLIDGAFGQVPAVRHKEILWALSRGVEVFGAGSLGALRAAELSGFGVKGHGFVYRWYRATPLADDDEVAVAMTPAELGSRPLGEALINMRLTFRELERLGGLQRAQRLALERIARKIYYLERSYPRVFERARDEFPVPPGQRFAPQPIGSGRMQSIRRSWMRFPCYVIWPSDPPDLHRGPRTIHSD
jgi:hypothetical protein